jgi:hemoglobin/transferrin/lactoferrin receptor protein
MNKFFIAVLFLSLQLYAQTVIVKDAKTEKPLELVSVYSGDKNRALITDTRGRVDISSFRNSEELVFRLLGYEILKVSYNELSQQNYSVLLKEQPIAIGNVVVSSNRWVEDRSEIAQTIELITPKDVEFMTPQTIADMLSMTGNVFVQKSQLGGGSPMIRGFATNRVLIVVDNVRMNTAIFRSGNIQNVISLDANSLSNAQVIFGPGSVIFGSDAIGGVMEFNTLVPQYSYSAEPLFKSNFMTRYSSANNERTGNLNFSIGLQNWGFLSAVTYSKFDDLKMGSVGPAEYLRNEYQERIDGKDSVLVNSDPKIQKSSGYSQINLMQKIRFKPDDEWEFNYGFHYSTTSDVPRYDRLIEYRNNKLRSAEWYYGPQKWLMNTISATNFSNNSFYDLSKIIFAHQWFEESRHDRNFNNNNKNNRVDEVKALSLNVDLLKELTGASQINYGAEVILNTVGSTGEGENIATGITKPISTRYPDGSVWNSYSLYANYKNKFSEKWILQTALRYTFIHTASEYDTTFFPFPFTTSKLNTGALTGSAGLVWHPEKDLQLNLSLSTGFRAPNIDDIGKVFDSSPGSVVVPNANLKPEYISSIEAGLIKLFSDNFKFELSAFYSYLSDALVRRDFQLNGMDSIFYDGITSRVQAIQNAAYASIWGIQSGLEFKFLNHFGFTAKFSYQNGKEEDDSGVEVPLRHAPPYYGTFRFSYENSGFNLMLYTDYNGEVSYKDLAPTEREKPAIYAKDDDGNPYSPGWFTLNLKGSYQINDYIQLNAGIENIFDKGYRTYSSGIVAPGRNVIGSIRVKM